MASNPATSIKPLEYAKETIIGMTLSLEQRFGCDPRNDLSTTLNTKFGVQPTRLPLNERLVKYFAWGVGGRTNDDGVLSSAQPVLGTNMSLYDMRPFRARPIEEDLSASERAKYAMRRVVVINGDRYCLYYLKRLDFSESQVRYIRTDPVSGVSTSYEINPDNLNPEPPVEDDNGVITDVADSVSVTLPASMTITGQEVLESTSVIDGGDMRFAVCSEIGFVSASTESIAALDANNNSFSYDEAIMAQLVDHYTWVGQPFLSSQDSWTRTINFSMKNLISQS